MLLASPHHRAALLTAIAAVLVVMVFGFLGIVVAAIMLICVGLALPRGSGSRLALLIGGVTLIGVTVAGLMLFGIGGEVQSGVSDVKTTFER